MKPTWHNVTSYSNNENQKNYLTNLTKGSLVYVETQYEVREAEPGSDTLQSQRQTFLRHGLFKFYCYWKV